MLKEKEVYFSRFKMKQNSFSNGSKLRKTPREIKRHLRVRFKDSKKKSSVIEEEAKLDSEPSAEKPRKTREEIKRHLRVKFTSSKKSMAEQKDPEFGPQTKKPRSRKDIKKHLRVKYIGTKNKSNQ